MAGGRGRFAPPGSEARLLPSKAVQFNATVPANQDRDPDPVNLAAFKHLSLVSAH